MKMYKNCCTSCVAYEGIPFLLKSIVFEYSQQHNAVAPALAS